jgi:hypothetical protein
MKGDLWTMSSTCCVRLRRAEYSQHHAENADHGKGLADPKKETPLEQLDPARCHVVAHICDELTKGAVAFGDLTAELRACVSEVLPNLGDFLNQAPLKSLSARGNHVSSHFTFCVVEELQDPTTCILAEPFSQPWRDTLQFHSMSLLDLQTTMPSSRLECKGAIGDRSPSPITSGTVQTLIAKAQSGHSEVLDQPNTPAKEDWRQSRRRLGMSGLIVAALCAGLFKKNASSPRSL